MRNVGRKLAFVLASTNHGAMIVNRFDYRMVGPDSGFGVGFQILERAAFDPVEVELDSFLADVAVHPVPPDPGPRGVGWALEALPQRVVLCEHGHGQEEQNSRDSHAR